MGTMTVDPFAPNLNIERAGRVSQIQQAGQRMQAGGYKPSVQTSQYISNLAQQPDKVGGLRGMFGKMQPIGQASAGNAVALPALAATAGTVATTPTEQYERRFGLAPNTQPGVRGLARDVGVRALGAASDLGSNMMMGIPGQFYRR